MFSLAEAGSEVVAKMVEARVQVLASQALLPHLPPPVFKEDHKTHRAPISLPEFLPYQAHHHSHKRCL